MAILMAFTWPAEFRSRNYPGLSTRSTKGQITERRTRMSLPERGRNGIKHYGSVQVRTDASSAVPSSSASTPSPSAAAGAGGAVWDVGVR